MRQKNLCRLEHLLKVSIHFLVMRRLNKKCDRRVWLKSIEYTLTDDIASKHILFYIEMIYQTSSALRYIRYCFYLQHLLFRWHSAYGVIPFHFDLKSSEFKISFSSCNYKMTTSKQ